MRTDFFDYDLPEHLIAREPCPERDQSRLLVVRRDSGALEHHIFHELPDLLSPGDVLVLNDTRVVPARLAGQRARTGGKWEGLFLRESDGLWELLSQTRGKLTENEIIEIEPGPLQLRLVQKTPQGHWLARPSEPGDAFSLLERYGQAPLPPYIRQRRAQTVRPPINDRERYQTVYAHQPGAVAAPTAGLHFTARLFERCQERDIGRTFLTLHIGLGTFQPIQA